MLKTYDTADTIKGGEVTATGQRNLMTLSRDKVIIDNQYYFSYVLACGTTDFASSENLISDAYANSDILYSAIRALGKERILSDIPYKAFDKTEVTITTSQANSWDRRDDCGAARHRRRRRHRRLYKEKEFMTKRRIILISVLAAVLRSAVFCISP